MLHSLCYAYPLPNCIIAYTSAMTITIKIAHPSAITKKLFANDTCPLERGFRWPNGLKDRTQWLRPLEVGVSLGMLISTWDEVNASSLTAASAQSKQGSQSTYGNITNGNTSESVTWLATSKVLMPDSPTPAATAREGTMLIKRVTRRRFHGDVRHAIKPSLTI